MVNSFQYHLSPKYLLISSQKIASTLLTQIYKKYYGKKGLPNFSISNDGSVLCDNNLHMLELEKTLKGRTDRTILILNRNPETRYISGLVQDTIPEANKKGIEHITELVNSFCVENDIKIFNKFLKENINNLKTDYGYIFANGLDSLNRNRNIVRIVLIAIFSDFFKQDFDLKVWGPHRRPYDSILAMICNINNVKNVSIFDIDNDGDLLEWLENETKENFNIENKNVGKPNNNSIINKRAAEVIQFYFQRELELIRINLTIEFLGYALLNSYNKNK